MSKNHSFNIEVAKVTGVVEAVFLEYFSFWHNYNRDNNKHFHDGHYWTYNTLKAFVKQFPYLSKRQIETTLNKLRASEYIQTANYNTHATDRTLWYSLTVKSCTLLAIDFMPNEKESNDFPEKGNANHITGNPISQNGEMQITETGNPGFHKNGNSISQNGEMIYKDTVINNTVNNLLETTVSVCADAQTDTEDVIEIKIDSLVADARPGTPPPTPAPAFAAVQVVNGRMKLPTLQDVKGYMATLGGADQAERLFDFYTSKGWKVGASAMKNWQAACRNWLRDNTTQNTNAHATSASNRNSYIPTAKQPFVFNYDEAINELQHIGSKNTDNRNNGRNVHIVE